MRYTLCLICIYIIAALWVGNTIAVAICLLVFIVYTNCVVDWNVLTKEVFIYIVMCGKICDYLQFAYLEWQSYSGNH